MSLNGAVAGFVYIISPCDRITLSCAILIGVVGGALVVFSVLFIDHVLKIEDPVGAVSVHSVHGTLGTLAAGLFNMISCLFYDIVEGAGTGRIGDGKTFILEMGK